MGRGKLRLGWSDTMTRLAHPHVPSEKGGRVGRQHVGHGESIVVEWEGKDVAPHEHGSVVAQLLDGLHENPYGHRQEHARFARCQLEGVPVSDWDGAPVDWSAILKLKQGS